jgi:hypothetical protein
MRMATGLVKSALCPKQYAGKPHDAFVAILAGGEVGFQPMQALKSIAVINGNPTIWGDGLPALAYSSGLLKRFEEGFNGGGDELHAWVRVERKDVEGAREFRFSVLDAKRAGLWDKAGPWKQYPSRMLQMRARSYAFRDTFADVLRGLHVAEEQADIERSSGAAYIPADVEPEPTITFDEPATEEVIEAEVEPVPEPEKPKPKQKSVLKVLDSLRLKITSSRTDDALNQAFDAVDRAYSDGDITGDEHAELNLLTNEQRGKLI